MGIDSMAGRWVLLGFAVLTGCFFITANAWAGLVDSHTDYGTPRAWEGFDEDFSPEWEGETRVVGTWQWADNGGSSWINDIDATMIAANWFGGGVLVDFDPGHWETRSTVRKVSSSSDSKVLNTTRLRSRWDYTATKSDDGDDEMARFARLISPQGKLLTEASSIAYRNASFGNDEFSVGGRVSATAAVIDSAEAATAESLGKSWFKATYELGRDTDFSLDIDLAILGQIDFSFTATDVESGEEAFCLETVHGAMNDGSRQNVSMEGVLEEGTYKFAVHCITDAAVNTYRQINPGGQAKFDVPVHFRVSLPWWQMVG